MVMPPQINDHLTAVYSIIKDIDHLICIGGRPVHIGPFIVVEREMSNYENRFIISNAFQVFIK